MVRAVSLARYTLAEMGRVWSEEHKFKLWLDVELAVCRARAATGEIPPEAMHDISRATVDIDRINELEKVKKHDVVSFLSSVAESVGENARYIHVGLTSYDIVDTALALRLRDATDILLEDLASLEKAITRRAIEHKDTLMAGRTHGVHAEPITFGFKLAIWVDDVRQCIKNLKASAEQVNYGKISGPVGTHATVSPAIEEDACAQLGLKPAPVSSQIVQRDRHAHYLTTLALVASTLEKFAVEIRSLQRTEVREVEEPFAGGQAGSSAMPHKRNPELAERVCGLARVMRGNAITSMESVALWHERDLSNSSAERLIIPESCILLDYCIDLMARVIDGMSVYPQRMLRNLESSYGLVFSQRVLLKLIDAGMSREKAYRIVQRNAMIAWQEEKPFKELLGSDPAVRAVMTTGELDGVFDYQYYLTHIGTAFDRLNIEVDQEPEVTA